MKSKKTLKTFLATNIDNTIIYAPNQTQELCREILENVQIKKYKYRSRGERDGAYVYNLPCSFDIETSSFYEGKNKRATMYMWQISICGLVIIGRTWAEWLETLETLHREFKTVAGQLHLLIYVQNLQYEFQWVARWLEWVEVFAIDNRKPVHALCSLGIEFKCSYVLSAFSLAKMGEHLTLIPVQKTEGQEVYDTIRHSESTLDWKTIRYGVNDVQVVVSFIYEEMEKNGNISKIPLTNTGYVRSFCRRACLQGFDNNPKRRCYTRFRYLDWIHGLTLELEEYNQARRGFQGGFTHTNPFWAGNDNVWDFVGKDFTSAYPSIIVLSSMFAMSKCEYIHEVNADILEESCKYYFCMFDVIFEGLESTFLYDNYISYSRAWGSSNCTTANGRIVKGDKVCITICGADWTIIKRTYKWKKMSVGHLRRYKRGYLPTDFVKAVLSLYADKTTLKSVKGKEIEYQQKKGMCNATFGMSCQSVFKETNIFNGEDWETIEPDAVKELEKYNTSKSRFLFYIWALTITAECRKNLWSAILECGPDYIYSDTDSIKYMNPEKHQAYFDGYNNHIVRMIEQSSKFHNIPIEQYMPKTIKGEIKIIGVWDDDGKYMRGKFLRAKCYMLQKWDGEITLTASGLNKKVTLPYLIDKYGPNIFENFTNKLYIPKGKTGKLVHTYIDYETQGKLIDYEGKEGYYHELSSIHLEDGDYNLNIDEFIEYLVDIKEIT